MGFGGNNPWAGDPIHAGSSYEKEVREERAEIYPNRTATSAALARPAGAGAGRQTPRRGTCPGRLRGSRRRVKRGRSSRTASPGPRPGGDHEPALEVRKDDEDRDDYAHDVECDRGPVHVDRDTFELVMSGQPMLACPGFPQKEPSHAHDDGVDVHEDQGAPRSPR